MTAEYDVGEGSLRLDQPTFDSLVAWLSGDPVPDHELEDLRQAGVIVGRRVHPDLAEACRAVTESVCQLRVDWVNDEGKERTADGWVSTDTVSILYDLADGTRALVDTPAQLLAALLARLVRLGPRSRHSHDPVHMSRDVFEGLLAFEPDNRQRAADRFGDPETRFGLVHSMVAGPWRRWTISMVWTTMHGLSASRSFEVIDVDDGLWWCETSRAGASMWSTNATAVWRHLTTLLPDDVQV